MDLATMHVEDVLLIWFQSVCLVKPFRVTVLFVAIFCSGAIGADTSSASNEIPSFQMRFANLDPAECGAGGASDLFVRFVDGDVLKVPRGWVYSVSSQGDLERSFPQDDWVLLDDHGCQNNPLPTRAVTLRLPSVPGIGVFHEDDKPELSIGTFPKSVIDANILDTKNPLERALGQTYALNFDPMADNRLVGCNTTGRPWPQTYTRVLPNGLFVCADAPTSESIAANAAVYKASRDVYPEYFESGYPFVLKCTGSWRTSTCSSAGVLSPDDTLFYRYRIVQNVSFHFQDKDAGRAPPLAEADIMAFDKWVRGFVREAVFTTN